MPKIPQAIDYGGRPSLQTNRVDRPSSGNVRTADALVSAATEFKNVMDQRQAKEDRLNYSLARNEIQQADLENRAALAEDQDWATHDERYSTGFNTSRDEILSRYNLSPADKAIMASESNLIHAQGRVAVGEGARRREIDEGRARYSEGKAKARASLIGLDQPSRNNVVLGQLDVIDAQVEAGYMTEEQGQAERESMTQDFALSSVEAMPVQERIRVLESSLRYRKGYGASLGQHSGAILSAAEDTGLPPELIAAVIQQESSGNAEARSDAGAVGLMQLREEAAKEMGVEDRLDPAQNVQGGASYLAKQFARFDGDPEAALAAYNWGPNNVRKAMNEYGDDWLSYAPDETKDYVAKLAPQWIEGGGGKVETNGKYATGEGPLDADAIRNGEGTGSIADFLHADTAAKMLDQARKGDQTNQDRLAAYSAVDAAKNLYPEDPVAMRKYIEANTSGSVRKVALTELDQAIARKARATEAAEITFVNDVGKEIRNGDVSLEDVKATDEYLKLSKLRQDALDEIHRQADRDEQYARDGHTQFKAREGDGGISVEGFESLPKYAEPPLLSQSNVDLTDENWSAALDERSSNALMAIQKELQNQRNTPITSHGRKPKEMVDDILKSTGFQGRTDLDTEQKSGISSRLKLALLSRISAKQGTFTPPRELTPEEANYELNQLMQQSAFIDDDSGLIWWDDDSQKKIATMTAKEIAIAYVETSVSQEQETSLGGGGLTMYEYLKQKAKSYKGENFIATDEQIGRAHFALKAGMSDEELRIRLTE